MSQEMAFYLLALIMVGALVFVVQGVLSLNKRVNDRITETRNQLLSLIYNIPKKKGGENGPTHLTGEVEMTHPKTGEKLKARARFTIKK